MNTEENEDETELLDDVELEQSDDTTTTTSVEPKPKKEDETLSALTRAAEALVQSTKQSREVKEVPITAEEQEKLFKVFKPGDDFIKDFFNLPDDADPKIVERCKKRWAEAQRGLGAQYVTGAHHLAMQAITPLEQRLAEAEGYISQVRARELRDRFNGRHATFADEKYNEIVLLAANSLAGKEFKNETEYFDALAEKATAAIKKFDPSFVSTSKTKTTTTTTPRLPRTSVGGNGGAGGQGGRGSDKPLDGLDYLD